MTTQYYKGHFDEPRTEKTEGWGTCDYYFETNQDGEVLRQIEVYKNGNAPIRYDAILLGLEKVGQFAIDKKTTVHMPRIGCGLAGGTWDKIEP
ncbi:MULTISPECIES: macro domain-containing protein [Proteiniphilum]|jgi:hypothetical protein|uniref:hypothetical protein n=1 Tax=Proteiniphilum TaxID=294702 RepID=UPI001EEADD91|nr:MULTISPECIES: hypothetical protein [Proteiniphilum]MDD4754236.1 hypothetical protein [Desulfitobacteriaceae bacterium]ULB33345.1 hypothetical protein KDN43_09925 [Proteiniphilum propionicum]